MPCDVQDVVLGPAVAVLCCSVLCCAVQGQLKLTDDTCLQLSIIDVRHNSSGKLQA